MRVIYNVKQCYAIRLKFEDKFSTFLTKLVVKAKASICSAIKENLLSYCRTFPKIVVIVILSYFNIFFITRPVSQRNTACNRNH